MTAIDARLAFAMKTLTTADVARLLELSEAEVAALHRGPGRIRAIDVVDHVTTAPVEHLPRLQSLARFDLALWRAIAVRQDASGDLRHGALRAAILRARPAVPAARQARAWGSPGVRIRALFQMAGYESTGGVYRPERDLWRTAPPLLAALLAVTSYVWRRAPAPGPDRSIRA